MITIWRRPQVFAHDADTRSMSGYHHLNQLQAHSFAREVIDATLLGTIKWKPSQTNPFFFEAQTDDGRDLSFCARNSGDPNDTSHIRTTLHVKSAHSNIYMDLSRHDTRRLIESVAPGLVDLRRGALQPIKSRRRLHLHRFHDLASCDEMSEHGLVQVCQQRCACGLAREVRRLYQRFGTRTLSITYIDAALTHIEPVLNA